MKISQIRKALVPIVGGAIAFATMVVNSAAPGVTPTEWIAGAAMLGVALGVYAVPNAP